jgi:hypothetical protein
MCSAMRDGTQNSGLSQMEIDQNTFVVAANSSISAKVVRRTGYSS